MDRDELVETLVGLSDTVEDLQATVETLKEDRNEAARERAAIRQELTQAEDQLEGEIGAAEDRLHRERSKLARRVGALEDELGVAPEEANAIAEAGQEGAHLSPLGRLIRHGPESVTDTPTATLRRAKTLVDNWERWESTTRNGDLRIRRLGSREHDLKSRLEDVRGEDLSWKQVYRAMEKVADLSDGSVRLKAGQEGKYVLVIREEVDR
jgi:regulator of replication initiation timing